MRAVNSTHPPLSLIALYICGFFILSPCDHVGGPSVVEASKETVSRKPLRGSNKPVLMAVTVHGSFSTNVDVCALGDGKTSRFVYGAHVALAETACGEGNSSCQTATPHICDDASLSSRRRMQVSTQQGAYSESFVFDAKFAVTSSITCQSRNCQSENDVEKSTAIKEHMEKNLLWSFHTHAFEETLQTNHDVHDALEDWTENLVVEGRLSSSSKRQDLAGAKRNILPTSLSAATQSIDDQSDHSIVAKSGQEDGGHYFPQMDGANIACISFDDGSPEEFVVGAGFIYDSYEDCCEKFNCAELTTTSSTTTAPDTRRYFPQIFGSTVVCIFSEPDGFALESGFVYDSYEECSETFQSDKKQTTNESDSSDEFGYFPDVDEGDDCIYGRPEGFVVKAGFVYDTYEDCCDAFGCVEPTTTTTEPPLKMKYFPVIFGLESVCVYGVPEGFVASSGFVYDTYEDCCKVYTCDTRTVSDDVVTTTHATTTSLDAYISGENYTLTSSTLHLISEVYANSSETSSTSSSHDLVEYTAEITSPEEYYPDFERGSGKCINDDKAPSYTRKNGHVYGDLETCCKTHYNYSEEDVYNCMNTGGSGLWFVDYRVERCVKDCLPHEKGSPACAIDPPTRLAHVFADPESCCTTKYNWIAKESCLQKAYVDSLKTTTTSTPVAATNVYTGSDEELQNEPQIRAANVHYVVSLDDTHPTSAPTNTPEWYPSLDGTYRCEDGNPPEWMIQPGYRISYIFKSKKACCAVYWCYDHDR